MNIIRTLKDSLQEKNRSYTSLEINLHHSVHSGALAPEPLEFFLLSIFYPHKHEKYSPSLVSSLTHCCCGLANTVCVHAHYKTRVKIKIKF